MLPSKRSIVASCDANISFLEVAVARSGSSRLTSSVGRVAVDSCNFTFSNSSLRHDACRLSSASRSWWSLLAFCSCRVKSSRASPSCMRKWSASCLASASERVKSSTCVCMVLRASSNSCSLASSAWMHACLRGHSGHGVGVGADPASKVGWARVNA